jgi:hypothetical protein
VNRDGELLDLEDFATDPLRLVQLLVGDRKPSEPEVLLAAEALRASFKRGWLLRGELRSGQRGRSDQRRNEKPSL